MYYPEFFDEVEVIELYDPLADFLGAIEGGKLEIKYLDLVKMAGHSCPTVAGAYLMSKMGLERLFLDTLPIRGEIEVYIKGTKGEGVNGVIGNLVAYVCGVSDEAGFKGIAGKYNRSNKLFYNADIPKEVRLIRLDTKEKVDISYDPSIIPPDPKMSELMQKLLTGQGDSQTKKEFQKLWQKRVQKILLSKELWPKMVNLS